MQKGLVLGVVGTAVALAAAGLIWLRPQPHSPPSGKPQAEPGGRVSLPGVLRLITPFDGTLFPPESIAPTFTWSSDATAGDTWLIRVSFDNEGAATPYVVKEKQWTPDADTWKTIKERSTEHPARISVTGVAAGAQN